MSPQAAPRNWSNIIFGALFALSLLFFLRIIWPFLLPVLLGAFIAVLFMPLHDWVSARLKKHGAASAGITTAAVFLLILVPLAVLAYFIARELLGALDYVRDVLAKTDVRDALMKSVPSELRRYLPVQQANAQSGSALLGAVGASATFVTNLLSASTAAAIDVFLMVIALYYFFLDGPRLVSEGLRLIPMDPRYSQAFVKEFKDVTYAIMWGNTLTAVIQGAIGTLGLAIAHVERPLLWGAAMTVVAMVPIGGTALVWAPIAVVLLLTHHIKAGIFLLLWGALVVSTVDNLIRPRLAGSRMNMHPLLVFLSMFGGIAVVGMMGLVVGPLVAAIVMAMIRIYQRDFLPALKARSTGVLQSASS